MRILETNSYEEMSLLAARMIGAQVLLKPDCVLGLATGTSPLGTYSELVKDCKAGILDFSRVRTVNLDEYCGLAADHVQSYRYFMNTNLFHHINIEAECRRYEALVQGLGGADLQLLGIGNNGHIGFNEPTEDFPRDVHTVQLTQSTIQANSRLFERIEDVPTSAVTMGIGTIMKAKRILLIAGAEKKEIVHEALFGKVTPMVPASVLQLHRDVTVITCK